MKKLFFASIAALSTFFIADNSFAQATVAMDFNRADCNGVMHHLFTNDLDSGNVVILEFFMGGGCTSCITAGHALETMKTGLSASHPGKIRAYVSGFQNTMSCATVTSWCSTNSITSTPIDSGEAQVAYYGGFGMPTIVILAGTGHKVIYTGIGFSASDTIAMKDSVNKFFNGGSAGINETTAGNCSFSISPNPAAEFMNIDMQLSEGGSLVIEIADITGKVVAKVAKETVSKGSFSRSFATANLANGLYLVRATLNGSTAVSKVTVAKRFQLK